MTDQRFLLPDVGEGLTEAEIVTWFVQPGDAVEVNQTICEIETAKSLVELPSPWAGVVTGLLVEPGTTVDVGTPIITIALSDGASSGSGGAASSGAAAAGGSTAAPAAATSVAVADAPVPDADAAPTQLAEASGSVLVGYGTAEVAATGRRRRVAPAAPAAVTAPAPAPAAGGPGTPSGTDEGARTATPARVLAKPPVRKLAKDLGVDLATVHARGPGGIVTREDVLAHTKKAEPERLATHAGDDEPWLASGTVSPDGRQTRVPVKSVRKRTAEAMVASAFTAPHVTEFVTVDVTRTMRLVETLKADRDFADVRVTPLLVAAKAVLLAIRRHPQINASWDDAGQEIVYKHYVNLGIAAATPRGLVVPNVKDAHTLDMLGLARALGDLTATARAGRTSPADMSDGTFTITNVGVFGIDTGTPILNPGEAGILAFGAIRQMPWVHKGKVKPRWVTQLALSFDHRLVDGELGARVLADVARVLEDPARGLVWG